MNTGMDLLFTALVLIQLFSLGLLLNRLAQGRRRQAPITAQLTTAAMRGTVSVILPTLNEAARIQPCLQGLMAQDEVVLEVLVVDSHSRDGTADLVQQAAAQDPRFRLIYDPPLPPDWIGKPWALHQGFLTSQTTSQWLLGIDADTQPTPGLIAGLLHVATRDGYDLLSLSPQFILKSPGELLLQPALLLTLVYRFGPTGVPNQTAHRVMANGQCFFIRRHVLNAIGGYVSAKGSFCDDVTLARHAAACGFKVGFLDGAQVLKVRMYEGAVETWHEWGRSLDLKDAATPMQTWFDVGFLLAVQGLPIPILLACYLLETPAVELIILTGINGFLLALRLAMSRAIASAYDLSQTRWPRLFWFSPLADPLAALRILLSAVRTPKQWRQRVYSLSR